MKEIICYWESETRFYSALLCEDLFGCWFLEKRWGGKFNRRRGGRGVCCKSYRDGLDKIKKLDRLRENNKYKRLK